MSSLSLLPAAPSVPPDAAPRRPTWGGRASGQPPAPPPLRPWSRAWRYALVVAIGLAMWLLVTADLLPVAPDGAPDDVAGAVGGALVLDLLLGAVALALLPLRRRRPVAVATLTAALTTFSAAAVGPAALAAVSMSTRRRWPGVLVTAAVWVAATAVYELVYRPGIPGVTSEPLVALVAGMLSVVAYGTCVATGSYVGARRELLASLEERAVTAEREQLLKADAAREAERTRIAREMHDVLAHRISLVAMHAGAMAYRTDLTREQTAEAAGVIQANAHLALTELRQILGVLRTGDGGPAEPPQPTLAELPALLADARETGTEVVLDTTGLPGGAVPGARAARGAEATDPDLPATVSRTAFRIVQEALTNARKHAPGAPVTVRLGGHPGSRLMLEVRNAVRRPAPDPLTGAASWADGAAGQSPGGPPGAGLGLVGLVERAELAGGGLQHGREDGAFVVRAWLPWS